MMKMILRVAVAAAFALGFSQAYAFHSGGVAECAGCHQMHGAPSPDSLLVAADASSTCLSCHEHAGDTAPSSYHISTAATDLATTPPRQRTPGGDFGWLKRTYGTGTSAELGQSHGHSIVASANGYSADTTNVTAPGGGTMLASNLSCVSCHDQHSSIRRFADGTYARTGLPIANSGSYNNSAEPIAGKTAVGVYRILRGGGTGIPADTYVSGASWANVFIASAPSTYNRTEAATDTRVAYGTGTGQWCNSCHPDMHGNTIAQGYHPVDFALTGAIISNYNAYVSSGIMTGGAAPFTSLVPFAEAQAISVLKTHARNDGTIVAGPSSGDEVTCMSCHRAHASGFLHAARWQLENEFLTKADSAGNAVYCSTDGTPGERCALNRNLVEVTAAYYDRPAAKLGAYQRQLCNKCHAKD
jgi:predicted CXXCH cytochrome family protein